MKQTKARKLGITDFPYREYDENNLLIYWEAFDGWWAKKGYDNNNNQIYWSNSFGWWVKIKYDYNNNTKNIIFHEDADGNYWDKKLMPEVPYPYFIELPF